MDFIDFVRDPEAPDMAQYAALINAAAKTGKVPPCAVAAICKRESSGNPDAKSPDGGWGFMQVTSGVDSAGMKDGKYMLDPESNLAAGTAMFADFLSKVTAARAALSEQQLTALDAISPDILFFAFGAYNAGPSDVCESIAEQHNPDRYTTDNYCAGTLAIYNRLIAAAHTGIA